MSTLFLSRLCWLAGTTNLAMHQMIMLTYKNHSLDNLDGPLTALGGAFPTHHTDLKQSNLLEQATFHHRTNSILLCILGMTAFIPNPISNVLVNQSLMLRKAPHIVAFALLMNAIVF